MKKLLLIFFLNLLSCPELTAQEKIEFKFEKDTEFLQFDKKNPGLNYLKLSKATKRNESILFFTGFSNIDSVKVINGKKTILDKKLFYSPQTGISEVKIINNTKNITIVFYKKIPIEIILDKNDLMKYKHIYVSRKDEKYLVEYSNKLKMFL